MLTAATILMIVGFAQSTTTTVVYLSDVELIELIHILFSQLQGSTLIPFSLLHSLGLDTASVISFLQSIGYTILWL
jgi:hypothetical protein